MSELVDEEGRVVQSAEQIEEWSENLRLRIRRELPQQGTIKTPDSIIQDLDMVLHVAGQNVALVKEAERTNKAAKRALARATATARQKATGKSSDDRSAEVVLETETEQETADNAEIAFNYAKSVAALTETTKSAVQTQARQVEIMYSLAGSRRTA